MGDHAPPPQEILGSVSISCCSSCNNLFNVRHLVIDGRKQRVLSQNKTSKGNICQLTKPTLVADEDPSSLVGFDLVKIRNLLCMPLSALAPSSSSNGDDKPIFPGNWKQTKTIIDIVHCHVFCYDNFSDIKLLLLRNSLWLLDVKIHLQQKHIQMPRISSYRTASSRMYYIAKFFVSSLQPM